MNARALLHVGFAVVLSALLVGVPLLGQEVPERNSANESETIARTTTRGPVTAVLTLSPAAPVIGDVLRLSLVVTATPEIEVLMPAFGESLGSFTILEYAPKDRIDADGRTVLEQRYALDVPMSGDWSIPPLVVEFIDGRPGNAPAPEGEDAYELLTETIEFSVGSVLPTDAEAELRPPLGNLEPLPTALDRARPYLWFGAIFLLAIPLVVWILVISLRGARRRSAYDIALTRLRKLQQAPRGTPEEIDRFYVELSSIVRRYLEDRFEIRAPESTTEEFLDRASRSGALTEEHRTQLVRFLQQADLVKFAKSIPGDLEIADSVRSAERFLEDTREDAPMFEVAEGSST